jgi:hypothetical protein
MIRHSSVTVELLFPETRLQRVAETGVTGSRDMGDPAGICSGWEVESIFGDI